MYCDYFGLNESPFSIAPDPSYLYLTNQHEEALAHLIFGLQGSGGIVLLTGEVGTGKTTLSRKLIEDLPDNIEIAWIVNPRLSAEELLASICDELSIQYSDETESIKHFTDLISAGLIAAHAEGRNIVLMIDEAQNLTTDTLEQLRLLTNLETNERKLLQIMLLGQPELKYMLDKRELRQLSQRITARFHLESLSRAESDRYIRHRLMVAGCSRPVFSTAALRLIHRFSVGTPRLINLLCDRAMLGVYSSGESNVAARHVRQAYREITGKRAPISWSVLAAITTSLLLLASATLYAVSATYQHNTQASNPQTENRQTENRQTEDRQKENPHASDRNPTLPTPHSDLPTSTQPLSEKQTAAPASPPASAPDPSPTPISQHESGTGPIIQGNKPAASMHAVSNDKTASNKPASSKSASSKSSANKPAPTKPEFWPSLQQHGSKSEAMRTLASIWGIDAKPDHVSCLTLQQKQLKCLSINANNWLLREYNRPAMIVIRGEHGNARYAVLRSIDNPILTIQIGSNQWQIDRDRIEKRWLPRATLLWQPPGAFTHTLKAGDQGKAVEWLATQLDNIQGQMIPPHSRSKMDQVLVSRLRLFQRSEDLPSSGSADALTLIRLRDHAGLPAPRLQRGN